MNAHFVLSKSKALHQYNILKNLSLKVSYSFKTNREVGKVLERLTDSEFSIHLIEEIDMLKKRDRIWFFAQAWNASELKKITASSVKNFVVDNEKDLNELLKFLEKKNLRINLLLRMKFQEHRVSSGKYFSHGFSSVKINEVIYSLRNHVSIEKMGLHVHRKSQNASEWNIKEELGDSISKENWKRIKIVNIGGGLPVEYTSYSANILPYIFGKIREAKNWLQDKGIDVYIEPGRFIAGPAVKLITEIIQIYENVIVVNTSLYNCALDTHLTGTKMLVENELNDEDAGSYYLIKGNSPTRDDIFRYKVKLRNPKIGDKIVFLNAGAYNYTTDFCGFKKIETKIVG